MTDADLKKALEGNFDAFKHEAEEAVKMGYGTRIIKQTIHEGVIVGVEELERKVNWKKAKVK